MRKTFIGGMAAIAIAVLVVIVMPGANSAALPQAAGKGPDILGLRVGMTPQEVYAALQSIDPTHRVTVGQILIPPVLGNQPAVYGMSPEALSVGQEWIAVSLTLPPNPQQVYMVHRSLTNTIHTTEDQIVASLHQKYGQEASFNDGGANRLTFMWVYDEKGQLATPQAGAKVLHDCGNTGLTFASTANAPAPGTAPTAGVLSNIQITNPYPLSDILDPSKNPQCQGWVVVRAYAVSNIENGVYNDSLDVTISDYLIQKRAAYALGNALNGVANKQQQDDLNKARQQSMPKL